jgi:acyl-CoA synthetase (AMP-forming)/AMP-acid ligase II
MANESGSQSRAQRNENFQWRPKGVKLALADEPIAAPTQLIPLTRDLFQFNKDTIYLSPAPLYHAAPLRWCMTTHRLGGTVVVMEKFDAEQALELIEQYRVTASQWVPTTATSASELERTF